ncbi:ABC transporter substrate-binding protein [Nakamurella silvestris]|nr:ABC transporter substrate-binding protein [Nakamurella silvestris]
MKHSGKVLGAVIAVAALAITACGSKDPLASTTSSTSSPSAVASETAAVTETAGSSTEGSVTEGSGTESTPVETSGSGSSGSAAPADPASITVGSADFPESIYLANVYAAALTKAGIPSTVKASIGSREVYMPALLDGSIDLLPEYNGSVLRYFAKDSKEVSTADVDAALPAALPAGYQVLKSSKAEDKDSVTVTKETADKYNLKTIEDLVPVAKDLIFGGAPELQTRVDGVPGLEKTYGLVFQSYKPLDSGGTLTINALKSGEIDAADIYTTTPAIYDNGFVVLEDTKNNFAAQNIIPLINSGKASTKVVETLDAVSAALTTENLTEELKKVYNGDDPATVAKAWVDTLG